MQLNHSMISAPARPIRHVNGFKHLSEFRKLYPVSKPDIFLEQTKTNALEGFIGTIAVGGREIIKISR